DYEMAAIVHQHLKAKDVEFYLKDALESCESDGNYVLVSLASGRILKTDMIILSIGVKPDTKLATDAGLAVGVTGGILTDRYMRTNDPDIYAVGDAVEVTDFINGSPALFPLAGPANRQGRITANNICGGNEEYSGTLGTSIVKVFDITVAITGNNERTLKKNGIAYEKSFTHSPNHAGYYPGANPMSIKLIFAKEGGKVLGAQIVGYEGVDKRIDVIATAIRAGMIVADLEKLELAYAPPYSSAKDPVNIAGYVASNILKNDVEIFHWDQVSELTDNTNKVDKADNADNDNNGNNGNNGNDGNDTNGKILRLTEIKGLLVDVRTSMEFSLGSIPGAVNIPVDELRDRAGNELNPERNIYIFCQVGLRGYVAARILKQTGYKNVKNLSGGYKTWQMATRKQANEDIYEYDKINKDKQR
ncbi:MAG: FAD-dependent oxidoreductase, partial [Clostridiales bacterium]|nr:FAD-dependent oxidoreductase [Clostridiales bacterium]